MTPPALGSGAATCMHAHLHTYTHTHTHAPSFPLSLSSFWQGVGSHRVTASCTLSPRCPHETPCSVRAGAQCQPPCAQQGPSCSHSSRAQALTTTRGSPEHRHTANMPWALAATERILVGFQLFMFQHEFVCSEFLVIFSM